MIIGATNRPDSIDAALLRPGRFDRLLYVPPPDNAARVDIFKVHTRNMPLDSDVDVKNLANMTEGFTGADIASVCQQAGFEALEENEQADTIRMLHFTQVLQRTTPSLAAIETATFKQYEKFLRHCELKQ